MVCPVPSVSKPQTVGHTQFTACFVKKVLLKNYHIHFSKLPMAFMLTMAECSDCDRDVWQSLKYVLFAL